MRILLIHNYYGSSAPSGENKVFEAERAMLEKHGHEVEVYTRHSDEIRGTGNGERGTARKLWGMVKGALCTIGNPFAARAVTKKCREFKPDVVHFHNTFPLISPLAVRAASKYAPVVMTLHNYRVVCAAGVPMRGGKVCSLCLDKKCAWDGVKHRCYRGGLLATLPLAMNIALYRKELPRWVSRFVVLSGFQEQKMVDVGLPVEKIVVKGNFISRAERVERVEKKNQIVYVGRLSVEKGVETLIKAFGELVSNAEKQRGGGAKNVFAKNSAALPLCRSALKNLTLVIVGDGVDRASLEELAKGLNVEFAGQKPSFEVRRIIAESKMLALPSECWEGMPMTVLESFAEGTPCIVSNLGALPEYVRNVELGEVFEAGNAESLAAAIKRLLSRSDYAEVCAAAKREAETKYSGEANYKRLMEIYGEVVRGKVDVN